MERLDVALSLATLVRRDEAAKRRIDGVGVARVRCLNGLPGGASELGSAGGYGGTGALP